MQTYSNPARESEPHALPDVEVWQSSYQACVECDNQLLYHPLTKFRERMEEMLGKQHCACPQCEHIQLCVPEGTGWFWWTCLPDSDPCGPFATQAEAIADAQSYND